MRASHRPSPRPIALLLCGLLVACGHRARTPEPPGTTPAITRVEDAEARAAAIRFEPFESLDHVYRSASSRVPHTVRLVVQDSAEWRAVWRRVMGADAAPLPPVDFSRDQLLVVGAGEFPCLGYGISVDTVFRDREARMYAVVRERHRGVSCGCLAERTSPVDVVRLPRTGRPVTFLERRTTAACETR